MKWKYGEQKPGDDIMAGPDEVTGKRGFPTTQVEQSKNDDTTSQADTLREKDLGAVTGGLGVCETTRQV